MPVTNKGVAAQPDSSAAVIRMSGNVDLDIGFATGLFAVDHMLYSSLHLVSTVTWA
jgi:hypothetical protein